MNITKNDTLRTPHALNPEASPDLQLPLVPSDILETSQKLGWVGVGIMVAMVTTNDEILLLKGRETAKYKEGTLGPLGETTKQSDAMFGLPPIVEQPLHTLFRGIKEELGISEPTALRLKMKALNSWVINPWPRGDKYPNQWNCAISFAVHVPPHSARLLEEIDPHNDEVMGIVRMPVEEVLADNPTNYRQGTQHWLAQLKEARLLTTTPSQLSVVNFSSVYFGEHDVQIDE